MAKLLVLLFAFFLFLNFFAIDRFPKTLSIDEAAIGVNAFNILKSGRDEYGKPYPLFFQSYGDYKMPGYIYLTSLSMAVFGKSEFSVRFTSALTGFLTIPVIFFAVFTLMEGSRIKSASARKLGLISALIFGTLPWHMQFTGTGFENVTAVFFFILGFWLFLLHKKTDSRLILVLSLISFCLAFYSYHSFRLIVPLWISGLFLANLKRWKSQKKLFTVGLIFLVFIFLPFSLSLLDAGGRERILQTTVFQTGKSAVWQEISSNLFYFLKNYLSFFSPEFLFSEGDGIGRHQIVPLGLIPKWEIVFLAMGAFYLLKNRSLLISKTIFWLTLVSPLAGAVSLPSPHTNRSLLMALPVALTIALGIIKFFENRGRFLLTKSIITVFFLYEFGLWQHFFFFHYPKTHILDWGGGYQDLVEAMKTYSGLSAHFFMSDKFRVYEEYAVFYGSDIKPIFVGQSWNRKDIPPDEKIIFVTGYHSPEMDKPGGKLIDKVYLQGDKKEVFAEIWLI